MMRWIILAAIAVLGTTAVSLALLYEPDRPSLPSPLDAAPSPPQGPPPKVQLAGQPVYTFGTMAKHAKSSHTWEVKNVGHGPLLVWLEESSCSCTVAKLDNKLDKKDGARVQRVTEGGAKPTVEVAPGQSTPIEVSWDTREWKSFYQTATLGTNDPETPSITLAIRGKVLPAVAVLPTETVAFPVMTGEEARSQEISVVSPDRADWKLTGLTTSKPDRIVVRSRPMTQAEARALQVEAGYHVVVQAKPGWPPGPFHEELVIQTDHPGQRELRVPIVGKVSGPISVVPERLRMPNVLGRQGGNGEVTLIVLGGRPVHFEVLHQPAHFPVTIVADEAPAHRGQYRLKLTVPAGTPPGPVIDRIVLKTDHPKLAKVEVPVTVYVSRGDAG